MCEHLQDYSVKMEGEEPESKRQQSKEWGKRDSKLGNSYNVCN